MTSGANFYELYRTSSIGQALTDTLDELISSNQLEPQLAMKIIAHFDKAFIETLSDRVKSRLSFKVCDIALSQLGSH
jgi:transcription initiation factor TFIIA small subunit